MCVFPNWITTYGKLQIYEKLAEQANIGDETALLGVYVRKM
jgi:hypothetical protein